MPFEDVIRISDLRVNCVVGVGGPERDRLQPLIVHLAIYLDAERAANSQRLKDTVDYAALSHEVRFILEHSHFRLLETAAQVLCTYLLLPALDDSRAVVQHVEVKLDKPQALEHALPSIAMRRSREWLQHKQETKPFGTVDIVAETKEAGVYRLNVAPHSSIPLHVHRVMQEVEMVLTSGLLCQQKAVSMGTVFHWEKGQAHVYDNPTDKTQSILCIDRPPFLESDEVQVER